MKSVRWVVMVMVMLVMAAMNVRAACSWPAWDHFKQTYISDGGRVIDPSDSRKITTSEGQSYSLFFALVANYRAPFDKVLRWIQDNPAHGSPNNQLLASLVG